MENEVGFVGVEIQKDIFPIFKVSLLFYIKNVH